MIYRVIESILVSFCTSLSLYHILEYILDTYRIDTTFILSLIVLVILDYIRLLVEDTLRNDDRITNIANKLVYDIANNKDISPI